MKAGRELDALIAEKVMGWKRDGRFFKNGYDWYVTEFNEEDNRPFWGGGGPQWDLIPKFSEDIAAAWKVVETMQDNGWYFILDFGESVEGNGVHANADFRGFLPGKEQYPENYRMKNAQAETAPHAICLAALKALE